jgi:hypothetical protein
MAQGVTMQVHIVAVPGMGRLSFGKQSLPRKRDVLPSGMLYVGFVVWRRQVIKMAVMFLRREVKSDTVGSTRNLGRGDIAVLDDDVVLI